MILYLDLQVTSYPSRPMIPMRVGYYSVAKAEVGIDLEYPTSNLWRNGPARRALGRSEGHVMHWGPVTDCSVHTSFKWS